MSFTEDYLNETRVIAEQINRETVDKAVEILAETRARGGRLFVLGVGGSAATASHAVN
ncbi:MAG: SIS domain-containing protein, partial [Planctomycetota bacterium]